MKYSDFISISDTKQGAENHLFSNDFKRPSDTGIPFKEIGHPYKLVDEFENQQKDTVVLFEKEGHDILSVCDFYTKDASIVESLKEELLREGFAPFAHTSSYIIEDFKKGDSVFLIEDCRETIDLLRVRFTKLNN